MASRFSISVFMADKILLDFIYPYAGYSDQDLPTLHKAVSQGDLAIESILENAISRVGGHRRTDENGEDFEDGSDAKKTIAMDQSGGRSWDKNTRISTKNKTGLLRIVVIDPDIKELFFFKIPYSIYKGQKMIRIPFNYLGGKPERFNRNNFVGRSYWECQVNTFEELCS